MVLFVTIFASLSLITSQPDTSATYDEKLQEGIEAFYNTEWEKADSLFQELMEEDEELRQEMYERICDETILEYKSNTKDTDSMEIEETEEA